MACVEGFSFRDSLGSLCLYFLQHVIDWVRKLFEHVSSCGALEGSSRHQLPLLWPFANRCFSLVCFRLPAVFEYETLGGVLFREKRRCSSNAPRSLRNLTGVRQKGYGFARPAQNPKAKTRAGFNLRLRDSNETALACLMLQECQQDLVLLCFKEKALRWSRYQKIKGKFVYQVPMSLHQIILSGGMLETSLQPTGAEVTDSVKMWTQ